MANEQPRYQAFLLRVWQVQSDGKLTWRASLESVDTGERHGFASLEILFEFLRKQMQNPKPERQTVE